MAEENARLVESPFGRLLSEALDRLAAPTTREHIVAEALVRDGIGRVPDEPAAFGAFACGPLHATVLEVLGEEAAEAVLTDLSPAFAQETSSAAASGVRRRRRLSLGGPRPGAPIVLIASDDALRIAELSGHLRAHAKVVATYDVFSLLSAASSHLDTRLTILIDAAMPSLRPAAGQSLARVVPPGSRILLFGESLRPIEPPDGSIDWRQLGDLPLEEVATLVLSIAPSSTLPPAPAGARRILVVHDNASWRARWTLLLESRGYHVITAPDGYCALTRASEEGLAAIIAPARLSNLDGEQLAAVLANQSKTPPPVLIVTDEELPSELPTGVVAMVGEDEPPETLLEELSGWIGIADPIGPPRES